MVNIDNDNINTTSDERMVNIQTSAHGFMSKTWFSLIPEILDDFENLSGTDRVLKNISGSGRVSGTRWSLVRMLRLTSL